MEVDSKGKGYLVTGGAGFIGSHLCRKLVERGDRVFCVDNLSTGSLEHISGLFDNPRFTFIKGDVREAELEAIEADGCYHLAALCGVSRVEREPLNVILTVIEGTLRVLRWCADKGVRALYVSSSEIYGSPGVHPQPETYWGYTNPVGPRSPYVEAKRAGEALCRSYRIERGLSVRIARLFNVYGPGFRSDDQRVIPTFIQAADAGEELALYGTGEATRSFCYVDDIVDGLIFLMDSDVTGPVNLGFPEEIGIRELADLVLRLTRSPSRIVRLPALCEDPPRRLPDISRAQNLLGWNPRVSLKEGLSRTVRWFGKRKISKASS